MDEREIARERWRQERQRLRLVDVDSEGFGTGGLAKYLDQPRVRLLLLPEDPACDLVEFDDAFWTWFRADRTDPVTGEPSRWGSTALPTSEAAVRANGWKKPWGRYLALFRHGGMEMCLGNEAIYQIQQRSIFNLVIIVSRVWCALDQYRAVVERLTLKGPWHIHLALIQTKETALGGFASGWDELVDWEDGHVCRENNLSHSVEIDRWPDAEATKQLAFRLGGWIDDCWGYMERRFIARSGPFQGKLDQSKYR